MPRFRVDFTVTTYGERSVVVEADDDTDAAYRAWDVSDGFEGNFDEIELSYVEEI